MKHLNRCRSTKETAIYAGGISMGHNPGLMIPEKFKKVSGNFFRVNCLGFS